MCRPAARWPCIIAAAQASPGGHRLRESCGAAANSLARHPRSQAQYVRQMVTRDADYDVIMNWARRSDQPTVAATMFDLFSTDLRGRLNRIPSRGLVLGTWIAYRQYATREAVEANFRRQYASWPRAEIV